MPSQTELQIAKPLAVFTFWLPREISLAVRRFWGPAHAGQQLANLETVADILDISLKEAYGLFSAWHINSTDGLLPLLEVIAVVVFISHSAPLQRCQEIIHLIGGPKRRALSGEEIPIFVNLLRAGLHRAIDNEESTVSSICVDEWAYDYVEKMAIERDDVFDPEQIFAVCEPLLRARFVICPFFEDAQMQATYPNTTSISVKTMTHHDPSWTAPASNQSGLHRFHPGFSPTRTFVNAVRMLAQRPDAVKRLFRHPNVDFGDNICVDLFMGGECHPVVMDMLVLCTNTHQPLLCHSVVHGECWPMLLEKACAVYLGSYERVARCNIDQLLHLLTGGFCTRTNLSDASISVQTFPEILHDRWRRDLVGLDQRAAATDKESAEIQRVTKGPLSGLENEAGGLWVVANVAKVKSKLGLQNSSIRNPNSKEEVEKEEKQEKQEKQDQTFEYISVYLSCPGTATHDWTRGTNTGDMNILPIKVPAERLCEQRWLLEMLCCRMHGAEWSRQTTNVIWKPMADTKWLRSSSQMRITIKKRAHLAVGLSASPHYDTHRPWSDTTGPCGVALLHITRDLGATSCKLVSGSGPQCSFSVYTEAFVVAGDYIAIAYNFARTPLGGGTHQDDFAYQLTTLADCNAVDWVCESNNNNNNDNNNSEKTGFNPSNLDPELLQVDRPGCIAALQDARRKKIDLLPPGGVSSYLMHVSQ